MAIAFKAGMNAALSERGALKEVARIAIAKFKLHSHEFSEEAIINDAVDAALSERSD